MKKIESENILLRKFQTEDAEEAFKNWAGIKEIADLSDYRVHTSAEETKQMIENVVKEVEEGKIYISNYI